MVARLGLSISRLFARIVPDPFVLVVLLTVVAAALALAFGDFKNATTLPARAAALLDAWRGDSGLWRFLAFSMQMCLVLLTGHALAAAPIVRRIIERLARIPTTTAHAAVLVAVVASATALVNWGLGLVVGALLARDIGRSMHARGFPCHFPLVAAAGYMGLMIWHGGLSGSAPLSMTTMAQARRVLPADFIDPRGDTVLIGLDRTLASPLNLTATLGLFLIIPICFWLLAPRRADEMVGFASCSSLPPPPPLPAGEVADALRGRRGQPDDTNASNNTTLPDRLDRSPILAWLIALPITLGLIRTVTLSGWQTIGLTEIIAAMLALGLFAHGSLKHYAHAVEAGASDCAGVVIQFLFYGGILAIIASSGLADKLSALAADHASARTMPLGFFLAASVLNMFITSGGGLWGVMGPMALTAGERAGVDPAKMVMAVAYGDQITNMLQPFWALPLLAITGVKARDIVGYTTLVMLAGLVWISAVLLVL